MKRYLMILAVLLLAAGSVFAQGNAGYKERSIKYWDEGPVTEADFQVRHLASTLDDVAGDLQWGISFEPVTDRIGNLRYTHPVSRTYMDQLQSWQDPDHMLPWTLTYLQTEFNMLEVFRRKMQREINAQPQDYNAIRDYYQRAIQSATEAYMMETDRGRDAAAVSRYEVQYQAELDSLDDVSAAVPPQMNKKGTGSTVYAGYSCELFGDPVAAGIGPAHGFNLGASALFGDLYLALDLGMGRPGTLKTDGFYYDEKKDYAWRKGVRCKNGQMQLLAGYTVLDRPYLALRPIVGAGVTFFDQDSDIKEANGSYKDSEISGLRLSAGAHLSWKLKRNLSYNYGGPGSYSETCLVFKAYAAHSQLKGLGETWSLNLGVALEWGGCMLKRNDSAVRP